MLLFIYYYVSPSNDCASASESSRFAEKWLGGGNECECEMRVGADGPFKWEKC